MNEFETKTVQAHRKKDLQAKVRALRMQGWERFEAEVSVIETGPGFRRATYRQSMRREMRQHD